MLRARFILVKKLLFSGAFALAAAALGLTVEVGMPICDLRDSERLLDCEAERGKSAASFGARSEGANHLLLRAVTDGQYSLCVGDG